MAKRIFKYAEHTFEDPGEHFSIEDIKRHLTRSFPEVGQATVDERTLDDGTIEVTFVKRSGTKGGRELGSYPRPAVRAFAEGMETRLRENDHKPGWADIDPLWFVGRLEQNLAELKAELHDENCDENLAAQAAIDIANYAMMVVDAVGKLPEDV